jgi:hypothetical protein
VEYLHRCPLRFYRGTAEEPTEHALKRHEVEVQQLTMALGETAAEVSAFRLAAETDGADRVDRVVFLALRGEDRIKCFWPVPLDLPAEAAVGTSLQAAPDCR